MLLIKTYATPKPKHMQWGILFYFASRYENLKEDITLIVIVSISVLMDKDEIYIVVYFPMFNSNGS